MKKRKRSAIGMTMGLAGASAGAGIMGAAIQPALPSGFANPMTSAGSSMSKFVSPAASLSGTAVLMKQTGRVMKATKKLRLN